MPVLTKSFLVNQQHTAQTVGSGSLQVLSTPSLIAFMENIAFDYCQLYTSDVQTTVGCHIDVKHLAPTKVGQMIDIIVTNVQQEDRLFHFTIEAFEGTKLIGKGTHTRAIVTIETFMAKLTS